MRNPPFDTYLVIRRFRKAIDELHGDFNISQANIRINQMLEYTRTGDLVSFKLASVEAETVFNIKLLSLQNR